MSSEEDFRRKCPCPCGVGEYEEVHYSDDWGRSETRYTMSCPKCKEKYVYDHTVIGGHPGNQIERGWVLKSVPQEEERYRRNVETKARELYYGKWQNCFTHAKTKKEIWEILTLDGKYYPSLGTFYNHTKGYDEEELMREIDKYFNYHDLKRVFEGCRIEPHWGYLGVNDEDRKRFRPENLSNPKTLDLMQKFERLLDEDTAPSISAIKKTIGQKNVPVWSELREYLKRAYDIEPELLFYGKKYGWTYRYRKSSKTLCALFPEKEAFTVLITLGKKELEKLNPDLPKLSRKMQDLINNTHLLHDGKWLWIRVPNVGNVKDIETILKVKRRPKLN